MSTRIFDARRERQELLAKCDAIVNRAELDDKRSLTKEEQSTIDSALAKVKVLNPEISSLESVNTLNGMFKDGKIPMFDGKAARPANGTKQFFPKIETFIRTGEGSPEISAALSEGDGLAAAIPPYELEAFRLAVPFIAPFEAAGATVFASDSFGMTAIKQPFVLPGPAVTTYSENDGPSTVTDASVVGVTLTPAKYAFLTKISEESDADIIGLNGAISTEGVRRVYSSTSNAATTALLSSLFAAGAFITRGSDN